MISTEAIIIRADEIPAGGKIVVVRDGERIAIFHILPENAPSETEVKFPEPNVAANPVDFSWENGVLEFVDAGEASIRAWIVCERRDLMVSCHNDDGRDEPSLFGRNHAALLWPLLRRYAETGEFGPEA